jgi:predicted secreted hydrolase
VQDRRAVKVRGTAWLDHEWSSLIMDADARGWDWVGLNLVDGSALMAFQVRNLQGASHWAAATWRAAGEREPQSVRREDIEWQPLRSWRSPRTGVVYPVAWRVRVGQRSFILQPMMDDQENDARGSTGTLYWEGAVNAVDAEGRTLGHGYLELTGYAAPVRF